MRGVAMNTPSVSIVMPFFNAAATLPRALDSMRAQTFRDWELIAVDDGSADDGAAMAAAAATEDKRIRVERRAHAGIVAALQHGCALARGGYFARMDADDAARPGRLERQMSLLEASPETGLCGTRVHIAGENVGPGRRRYAAWLNALVTHEAIVRDLFIECPVAHPAFMMRRDAFLDVGGYVDRGWPEDYGLVMRLWRAGWKLENVPETLLDWHERPGRLSMTGPRYSETAFRRLKRHYLFETCLADREAFHQWGAGEVGKRWLREWQERHPAAAVDINPRKIGREIHGTPIIAPESLPPPGGTFIVIAVGAPGAREEIRAWLSAHGYLELRDFRFVA